MADTKYYKTVFTVTVLSEFPVENFDLTDVLYEINEGSCVGQLEVTDAVEVSEGRMAELLYDLGSEPEFFGLEHEDEEEG